MKFDLLVRNCAILPVPGEDILLDRGYIGVFGNHIAEMGAMEHCPQGHTGTVVDGQGQLAMPGLINGHCHAPMTLFRGLADDLDLATWLNEHIFPAEANMVAPDMVYWCGMLAAAEMLLSGTTTVADGYFYEDCFAQACVDAGLRCLAAQAVIDFPAPGVEDPGENIEVAEQFLQKWQGRDPLVTPAVFAHAPYTCANDTLRRAKALAGRYQVPFFIHVAETRGEQEQIASPLGATPVEHLDALGVLDGATVCVHGVWLTDRDIRILAKRGAAVVTCPQSNAKLASGRAPLVQMMEQGVRLSLGTDGTASGNNLDLFREMGFAAMLHKVNPGCATAVPARGLLAMATHGGADALGLPPKLGRIQPGALADLILVDLRQPHLQPFHSPNLLVYSGCGADVQTVIVNGRPVVMNGLLQTMDVQQVKRRVRALAEKAGCRGRRGGNTR